MTRFVLAAAAVVAIALGGLYVLNRGPNAPGNVGGQSTPTPSLSPSPTPPATTSTSPAPSPSTGMLDTSQWVAYTSKRYDFKISHPADWQELPATRTWSFEADTNDWLSPGMDAFTNGSIRVSAWEVPLESSFPTDPTWTDVETWIEGYCLKINKAPCGSSLLDTAVKLCVEWRDCHPSGLLVSGESEVQAFFTSGIYPGVMVIVTVWWSEGEPATAPYGGTRRLLEGFLGTMNVWDESIDRSGPPPTTGP